MPAPWMDGSSSTSRLTARYSFSAETSGRSPRPWAGTDRLPSAARASASPIFFAVSPRVLKLRRTMRMPSFSRMISALLSSHHQKRLKISACLPPTPGRSWNTRNFTSFISRFSASARQIFRVCSMSYGVKVRMPSDFMKVTISQSHMLTVPKSDVSTSTGSGIRFNSLSWENASPTSWGKTTASAGGTREPRATGSRTSASSARRPFTMERCVRNSSSIPDLKWTGTSVAFMPASPWCPSPRSAAPRPAPAFSSCCRSRSSLSAS